MMTTQRDHCISISDFCSGLVLQVRRAVPTRLLCVTHVFSLPEAFST